MQWEIKDLGAVTDVVQNGKALKAGSLVFSAGVGLTVLADIGENQKCYLIDLSRHNEENPKSALAVFYSNRVRRVDLPSNVAAPLWRQPGWLAPETS